MMYLDADVSQFVALGMKGLFFILLLFFAVQAIFLAYHWFAFGNNKALSVLALTIYLCGGAILLMTFAIALNAI